MAKRLATPEKLYDYPGEGYTIRVVFAPPEEYHNSIGGVLDAYHHAFDIKGAKAEQQRRAFFKLVADRFHQLIRTSIDHIHQDLADGSEWLMDLRFEKMYFEEVVIVVERYRISLKGDTTYLTLIIDDFIPSVDEFIEDLIRGLGKG